MTETVSIGNLITPEMESRRGQWMGIETTSTPISESDIRRWAIATYWPGEPARLFVNEDYAKGGPWRGLVAPEDFNPFAWTTRPRPREAGVSAKGMSIDAFGVPTPHRHGPVPREVSLRIGGMNAGRVDEFGPRMRLGDVITSRQRLRDWREETTRLGPALFVRNEIEWANQRGEVVRRRLQTSLRYVSANVVGEARERPPSKPTAASDIPPWSRTTGLENWTRFAAVNDEFVDIHMDDDAGRRAGNADGAFGMGNLRYAYMINALRDWLGDGLTIQRLECQFRAMNRKGDTLTVWGRVTSDVTSAGRRKLEFDLDVLNQDGVRTCPGTAIVEVPALTDPPLPGAAE